MAFRVFGKFLVMFVLLAVLSVKDGQCEDVADVKDMQESEGRTFGHHFLKRISFAIIPIIYKMGMMTTLLITLTIMSTKGLAIGVLLLILGISQVIARGYGYAPPLAAPLAAAPQPAVYPVVYSRAEIPAVAPVIHKLIHTPHHAHTYQHQPAPVYQPYGGGWDRSGATAAAYTQGQYGREGTDSMERQYTEE